MADNKIIKFGSFNILNNKLVKYNTDCIDDKEADKVDSTKRYDVINKILEKTGLDIIFLQEVGDIYKVSDELKNKYYAVKSKTSPNLLIYILKEKFTDPIEKNILEFNFTVYSPGAGFVKKILDKFESERIQVYTTTFKDKSDMSRQGGTKAAALQTCEIVLVNIHLPVLFKKGKKAISQIPRGNILGAINNVVFKWNYGIIAGDTNTKKDNNLFKYNEKLKSCVEGDLAEGYTSFKYGVCDEGVLKARDSEHMYDYLDHIYIIKENIEIITDTNGRGVVQKYDYNENYELIDSKIEFNKIGPPFCDEEKTICNIKNYGEQKQPVWPSDHAIILATFKFKNLKPIRKYILATDLKFEKPVVQYKWITDIHGKFKKVPIEERQSIILEKPKDGGGRKKNYKNLYHKLKGEYKYLKSQYLV